MIQDGRRYTLLKLSASNAKGFMNIDVALTLSPNLKRCK